MHITAKFQAYCNLLIGMNASKHSGNLFRYHFSKNYTKEILQKESGFNVIWKMH